MKFLILKYNTTATLDIKMQHKRNKTRLRSITLQSMQLICCLAIFIHFTQKKKCWQKENGRRNEKKLKYKRLFRPAHTGKTVILNCGEPHFVVNNFSSKTIQLYTAVKRQVNKVQCSQHSASLTMVPLRTRCFTAPTFSKN